MKFLSLFCSKKPKFEQIPTTNLDADDLLDDDDEDDSDASDSEDNDAQLLAELAKIKKERAAEEARKVSDILNCFLTFQYTFKC